MIKLLSFFFLLLCSNEAWAGGRDERGGDKPAPQGESKPNKNDGADIRSNGSAGAKEAKENKR